MPQLQLSLLTLGQGAVLLRQKLQGEWVVAPRGDGQHAQQQADLLWQRHRAKARQTSESAVLKDS